MGVGFHVGGSLAASVHGLVRTAFDVDLAADLTSESANELACALRDAYLVDGPSLQRAVLWRTSFSLLHLETLLKIDVFVPADRPFDRRMRERVRALEIPCAEGVVRIPVVSAEDVVVTKLEWYRDGGEVTSRHWDDAVGVLLVQESRIDRGYLDRWTRELGLEELLQRAFAAAAALI